MESSGCWTPLKLLCAGTTPLRRGPPRPPRPQAAAAPRPQAAAAASAAATSWPATRRSAGSSGTYRTAAPRARANSRRPFTELWLSAVSTSRKRPPGPACRLVGEAYPFRPWSRLVLTADNHNSVNGLREFARARGAAVRYVPLDPADLRVAGQDGRRTQPRRPAAGGPRRPAAGGPRRPGGRRPAARVVRVPGAEQLQRRPAPAALGGRGPGRGLRRAARRGRVRPRQPALTWPWSNPSS